MISSGITKGTKKVITATENVRQDVAEEVEAEALGLREVLRQVDREQDRHELQVQRGRQVATEAVDLGHKVAQRRTHGHAADLDHSRTPTEEGLSSL